jgi:hypothetical protein
MRLAQNPVREFTLLPNPENSQNIANFNDLLRQYNAAKTTLNQRVGDPAATDGQIRRAYGVARGHLNNIWDRSQNDQGIRARIGGEFNQELDFIIRVAGDRGYRPVDLAPMDAPPVQIPLAIPPAPPAPDFYSRALPYVRLFSLLVGVVSFGWGIGVVTKVYEQGFKEILKRTALPFGISLIGFTIFGATYIDLRPRADNTLPNFNPTPGGLL